MDKKIKNETENAAGSLTSANDVMQLHYYKPPVPLNKMLKYEADLENMLRATERDLSEVDFHLMTDAQRRRLLGSGVRRLGFIVKTFEVASDNPEFVPPFLNMDNFGDLIMEINSTRNITISLEQLLRINTDILLIAGDDAYKLALMYYSSVRDAARRGVPGAQAIFRALQLFFRRGKRTDEEPTTPEVERDVRALLHGKKDGEIVIKAEAKHVTAASREVTDDTFKPKAAFKEKIQGTICSQCGAENENHAKFCINCGTKLVIND
jgi:ribosomal protein L40E